ncbi:hypothetical protein IFR05_010356 [Cadophora sp. M221]|nr:hypothetical protein IFR05_010356 [Cadophora sp. M221]
MPPKPFNPPRPSTSSTGTKPRGRPKGTSTNPSSTTKRKSTDSIHKPPKSKTKTTSKGKGKDREADTSRLSGFSRPRVSNASTVLNISSGDEDEDEEEEDRDIEMDSGDEEGRGEDDDDEDPFSSQPLQAAARRKSTTSKANTSRRGAADENEREMENAAKADGRQISIPPDLINVIMHGFFNQENTRMSKDANAAVGRYIETFVREGLNRADWAKRHGWEEGGLDGGGGGVGDGAYLEVEDLERLAPQLLLDF